MRFRIGTRSRPAAEQPAQEVPRELRGADAAPVRAVERDAVQAHDAAQCRP